VTAVLLAGGRVLDPASGVDAALDVLIDGERVAAVGQGLEVGGHVEVVDVTGCWVTPGLVDLHTHLREPGGESDEDVASGSRAAAAGGFTVVCAMANTDPVCDTSTVAELVWQRGRDIGLVDVRPVGAITRGLAGVELAPFGELRGSAAEVDAFSDDGLPVADPLVMRRALEYARAFDVVVCDHAQDPLLSAGGQMHEGAVSSRLGLPGWPREAEDVMVARDLILAEGTGGRLHVLHVSTAGSVALVRAAKERGVRVTAEVTPHHLALTDELVADYDPVMKVNPPLRAAEDLEALRAALTDGTIDAVATDHAPHGHERKQQPWEHAPHGMVGLETAFAVVNTVMVASGRMSPLAAIERMTAGPARVRALGGHGGPIAAGRPANLAILDPDLRWTPTVDGLVGRSRNSPFLGRELVGRARHTLLRGRFALRDGRVAERRA